MTQAQKILNIDDLTLAITTASKLSTNITEDSSATTFNFGDGSSIKFCNTTFFRSLEA